MAQLQIPGTSIQYSNPKQVDQNTLVFPNGMVTCPYLSRRERLYKTLISIANQFPGGFNSRSSLLMSADERYQALEINFSRIGFRCNTI